MNLSVVIIGDEILLGRVTDTNSGLIARTFSEAGWDIKSVRTVGDNKADIRAAIDAALAESQLVITTGGLGPTRDDITKAVMTEIFGGETVFHAPTAENIDRIFADRGLQMNELTRGQAYVPSSCRVIVNKFGTAPVMWFEKNNKVLIAMPGVPYETRGMLKEGVAQAVAERFHQSILTRHREFTVVGISESALAEQLAEFEDSLPGSFKLAYLPSPGFILLRLDAHFEEGDNADAVFDRYCLGLEQSLGTYFTGYGKQSPAMRLLALCRRHGLHLATAESCTGGNIAHMITEIPGCSDVYAGGVVSYSNDVKRSVLGVDIQTLETHGAVSAETVGEMLAGVCRATGAQCAVATSGIAGPGGEVPGKPVGTVWIGACVNGRSDIRLHHFGGDRQAVIERATAAALNQLSELIKQS